MLCLRIFFVLFIEKPICHCILPLNNTLSFSFFRQNCALQGNLCEIYRKMWKYCLPSDVNHIRRLQMAINDLSESKMTNMDPVMEPIFTKMIPCPGVGILKMISCSAARPRTEKYLSTPPPLGMSSLLNFVILARMTLQSSQRDSTCYSTQGSLL